MNLPGLSALHPEWLLALLLVPAIYLVWRRWPPPLGRSRGRFALALRVCLVVALVVALSGVRVTLQPHQRAIVAVVDLSASTRHSLDAESTAVRALAARKGADDLFGIVTFGHDAAVELPPTREPQFEVFQTQPDPTYTDISGALRLAAGIIPDGYARQLVLISDGRQNLGDAAATVAALRSEGVRVDVLPVGSAPSAEVLVASVDAPAQLRVGQRGIASVRLRSTGAATGLVVFSVDGKEVETRSLQIPAGISTEVFNLPDFDAGLHRARAELANAVPDTYTDNNVGEAAIRVLGRPAVLVLEATPSGGDNIVRALAAAGIKVDRRPASQAPVDTAVLGQYDSIVVVDTPADAFPAGALDALAATVRDLGHGLVAIGGSSSYGPGGWQKTGLESALPVRMDLPPRKEKPRVAVVFMLETTENQSLDTIAITATEAAIDQLGPDDQVGVTNNGGGWAVPLQHVTDKKAINALLESSRASLMDGPYLPSVRLAGDALAATDAPLKHIVMLGDGDEIRGDQAEYQSVLQGYRAVGITTSTVGINTHSDAGFMVNMQDLAKYGGGRFYQADSAAQVPQLFLKESQVALKPWYEQDPFFPKVTAAGDLLASVPLNAFPQLGGYVVTTPKPGAEIYFLSPKDDPVLAGWQYGLGRSVAWTSDARGQWTAGLLRSDVSAKLFTQMVAWTLPSGTGEQLQTEARVTGDSLALSVNGPTAVAGGATVKVGVLGPDLKSSTVNLPAVAPGRWQGQVKVGAVGTYLLHVVVQRNGVSAGASDVAVVVPYSPEYLELGRDDASLRQYAKLGGSMLNRASDAWSLPTLPVRTSVELYWLLLALVALLWPLDIAVRRLTMTRMQALAAARSLATFRRPSDIDLEAPPELARLRNRIAPYRRRSAASPPPPVVAGVPAPHTSTAAGQTEGDTDAEALSARLLEARRKRRGSGD